MSARFTESVVEEAALAWLESTGWRIVPGPDIAPGMLAAERRDYGEGVLARLPSGACATRRSSGSARRGRTGGRISCRPPSSLLSRRASS